MQNTKLNVINDRNVRNGFLTQLIDSQLQDGYSNFRR